MEKTISPEERIRRAEEIYSRRRENSGYVRMSSAQVRDGKEKKQFSLYKKTIIQVLICILIYLIFSLIKEANYIFSDEVLNKTKQFLSTDINFEVIAGNAGQFFENNKDKLEFLSSFFKNDEQNNEQLKNEENKENQSENSNNEQSNSETNNDENKNLNNEEESKDNSVTNEAKDGNNAVGMGGATNNEATVTVSSNNSSKKTQMQIDAEYINANFSFVLPIKGTVTSRYGKREETKIVSADHYGIDIGVNVGTTVVAAMEGKVSLVSNEGEYGTHVKIINKDVTTIYAHCSKILVKEGQTVKKGEKIALSGNTGRTTGPHLHFEIRRNNRTVDPELVLRWG